MYVIFANNFDVLAVFISLLELTLMKIQKLQSAYERNTYRNK